MSPIGQLIFVSRWLQLPLYLGLIIAQAAYAWWFIGELVELAMAIVGITSVHLLQTFIEDTADATRIKWHVIIHMAFVVSALILAVINRIDADTATQEADHRIPEQRQHHAVPTPIGSRHTTHRKA